MFGPYTTSSTLRENYRFLYKNQLFYWYHNIDSSLILTPGAAIYDSMKREGRVIPPVNFWEYPNYEFINSNILKLAQHYQHLRTIYPHLDVGNPLVLKAENIITRLKNKMNKQIAVNCEQEIKKFKEIYYKNKNILNELGYQGTMEILERVEKDGLKAALVKASEPFLGKNWGTAIYEIEGAYLKLLNSIEEKGFGFGGLVFNAELTKREQQTNNLENNFNDYILCSNRFIAISYWFSGYECWFPI